MPDPIVEFLTSTKFPTCELFFRTAPGLILAYGPTIQLSPMVAPNIIVLGLMSGGRVSFVFFPSPEPDIIYVNFNFSPGTSKENTAFMITELEKSLLDIISLKLPHFANAILQDIVYLDVFLNNAEIAILSKWYFTN